MSKESVISMRNALKGNKNLPVKVYSDNDFIIIDESNPLNYTKWDDENGVLYTFRLTSFDQSRIPDNSEQAISVGAVLYEFIQAMEVAPMPLKYFDDVIGSMQSEGITFKEGFTDNMKYAFTKALDPNIILTNNVINGLTGAPVKDGEYYYDGKFVEPFKETRRYADRNAEVDRLNAEKAAEDSSGGEG